MSTEKDHCSSEWSFSFPSLSRSCGYPWSCASITMARAVKRYNSDRRSRWNDRGNGFIGRVLHSRELMFIGRLKFPRTEMNKSCIGKYFKQLQGRLLALMRHQRSNVFLFADEFTCVGERQQVLYCFFPQLMKASGASFNEQKGKICLFILSVINLLFPPSASLSLSLVLSIACLCVYIRQWPMWDSGQSEIRLDDYGIAVSTSPRWDLTLGWCAF